MNKVKDINSLKFTGRLDINNKEIHDGHIINIIKNDKKIYTGEVILSKGTWYITDNITKYKLNDYKELEIVIHKSDKAY